LQGTPIQMTEAESDLVARARRRAGQEAVKYKGREAEYPDDMWLLIKMADEIERLEETIKRLREQLDGWR
jgi:HAMP domain-containing protein